MPKKIMPKRDYALKGYANLQANRWGTSVLSKPDFNANFVIFLIINDFYLFFRKNDNEF